MRAIDQVAAILKLIANRLAIPRQVDTQHAPKSSDLADQLREGRLKLQELRLQTLSDLAGFLHEPILQRFLKDCDAGSARESR